MWTSWSTEHVDFMVHGARRVRACGLHGPQSMWTSGSTELVASEHVDFVVHRARRVRACGLLGPQSSSRQSMWTSWSTELVASEHVAFIVQKRFSPPLLGPKERF